MATIQLTKIVAPSVWGWLGDKTGQRVRLVRFGAITGSLFFAGVFMEPGFYGLLLVMLAFTFFWNAILPLYEVITLRTLGEQKEKYGRVRLWGRWGSLARWRWWVACWSWCRFRIYPGCCYRCLQASPFPRFLFLPSGASESRRRRKAV